MSFQGDVRGIGLAELLQGLARGRKEGILTLTAKGGLRCTLGLEEGKAFLLPDPDEDPEIWRDRVRDAWADDPAFRVDYLRMSEVARAQRLENLYRLLDGGGVHFRFDPGVLPKPVPGAEHEAEHSRVEIFCDGIQVEFVLLEYARVVDELEGEVAVHGLPSDMVPCVLDPAAAGNTQLKFLEQCNATSTLQEIADRLGWPIRVARLTLGPALRSGCLRLAHSNEQLGLALHELAKKNFSRAAVRLAAWCRDGMPGPVTMEVAERLANEWLGGRLTAAMQAMTGRARRTLLRRLDHALRNASQSAVHWLEAERIDKTDRIAKLKRMASEFKEGSDPDRPGVRELLDLSRDLREQGFPRRGGPLLVMAAHQQPANMTLQLELGMGLVAANRPLEGAPWILAGSRELLDNGHADRAISPLRALLEKDPRNRECRQLLSRARRQSTEVKKLRKNLLVGLAAAVMLSAGAIVKVRHDADFHRRLDEVRELIGTPDAALLVLRKHFGKTESEAVNDLRGQIEERKRLLEFEERSAWLAVYHEVQVECTRGDPLLAIEKIQLLPPPPKLRLIREPWPLTKDLYQGLVDHLFEELQGLGPPVEGSPAQARREQQIDEQADAVVIKITTINPAPTADQRDFIARMEELRTEVGKRQAKRDKLIRERLEEENLQKQDELYRMAEAYAKGGDFQRALKYYNDILVMDLTGRVEPVLRPTMNEVERKDNAVRDARELAREGRHPEALSLLASVFDDPDKFMLPWRVESFPSGVRVESGDRVYTTPFDVETTSGETLTLVFTRPGFDNRTIEVGRPGDLDVHLSRSTERSWRGDGRIDAIPVSVGEDHIVVDRKGKLARIGPAGELRWQDSRRIQTLSGIARAPVFMPHRPGYLLLLTEDGDSWILDSDTGELEGPWSLGSAPIVGPAPNAGHVSVLLSDRRLAMWLTGLKPVIHEQAMGVQVGSGAEDYRYGANSGFQVARRRTGDESVLPCQWNEWVIEVADEVFLVYPEGRRDEGYSVLREGEWEYLAWESASGLAPEGRLWISDGAGVRSFVPLPE